MKTLLNTLTRHGVEFDAAEEIVLFGSRTDRSCESPSDWDVLCVGSGETRLGRDLDVIWLTPDEVRSSEWLGSELGTHVARYGQWIRGAGNWREIARIARGTATAKEREIHAKIGGYGRVWNRLGARSRTRFGTKIRRDLQRLALLSCGEAVPARPQLDRWWAEEPDWTSWAKRARFDGDLSPFSHSAA